MTSNYEIKYDIVMPDSAIGYSEMNLYGYKGEDMLPLLTDRALELFDAHHTVYMLYEDGTESMIFEREEITKHDGIFGIEASEWIASLEYADMVKALDNGEASQESALIFGGETVFGIYQLKDNAETKDLHYATFNALQRQGVDVERKNYALIYTAPFDFPGTLVNQNDIYKILNIDHPASFTGFDLVPGDVIVLQCCGKISSYYVDDIGFTELPSFLGNEQPRITHADPSEQTTPEKASPVYRISFVFSRTKTHYFLETTALFFRNERTAF